MKENIVIVTLFAVMVGIFGCREANHELSLSRDLEFDGQTRRRIGRTGLTAFDRELAYPGYVLYAPISGGGTVYLIDLDGNVVHEWHMPYAPGSYGYLLPNGNLFYMGKVRDECWNLFPEWHRFKGGVMVEVDPEGNIVWEHRDPYQHHDARRTPSGGAVYLTVERMPDEVAALVKGGIPGTDRDGMWADVVVEVDSEGNRIWEWRAYEHLDFETDVIQPNCERTEWSHGNTVVSLGDSVMVSFRHISTVGIIDKKSGEFVWKLGDSVLAQQHDPNLLPNGNILIFDNGQYRKDSAHPYSRVIEVDLHSNEIVWSYKDSPVFNFFSPHISGARRLVRVH